MYTIECIVKNYYKKYLLEDLCMGIIKIVYYFQDKRFIIECVFFSVFKAVCVKE